MLSCAIAYNPAQVRREQPCMIMSRHSHGNRKRHTELIQAPRSVLPLGPRLTSTRAHMYSRLWCRMCMCVFEQDDWFPFLACIEQAAVKGVKAGQVAAVAHACAVHAGIVTSKLMACYSGGKEMANAHTKQSRTGCYRVCSHQKGTCTLHQVTLLTLRSHLVYTHHPNTTQHHHPTPTNHKNQQVPRASLCSVLLPSAHPPSSPRISGCLGWW